MGVSFAGTWKAPPRCLISKGLGEDFNIINMSSWGSGVSPRGQAAQVEGWGGQHGSMGDITLQDWNLRGGLDYDPSQVSLCTK